jgi:hypothetical protein
MNRPSRTGAAPSAWEGGVTKKRREQKPTHPIAIASNGEQTTIMTADGKTQKLAQPWEMALTWARRGDWGTLADFIEDGGLITRDIRVFLVAVLRRKVKKPNNRAQSFSKSLALKG